MAVILICPPGFSLPLEGTKIVPHKFSPDQELSNQFSVGGSAWRDTRKAAPHYYFDVTCIMSARDFAKFQYMVHLQHERRSYGYYQHWILRVAPALFAGENWDWAGIVRNSATANSINYELVEPYLNVELVLDADYYVPLGTSSSDDCEPTYEVKFSAIQAEYPSAIVDTTNRLTKVIVGGTGNLIEYISRAELRIDSASLGKPGKVEFTFDISSTEEDIKAFASNTDVANNFSINETINVRCRHIDGSDVQIFNGRISGFEYSPGTSTAKVTALSTATYRGLLKKDYIATSSTVQGRITEVLTQSSLSLGNTLPSGSLISQSSDFVWVEGEALDALAQLAESFGYVVTPSLLDNAVYFYPRSISSSSISDTYTNSGTQVCFAAGDRNALSFDLTQATSTEVADILVVTGEEISVDGGFEEGTDTTIDITSTAELNPRLQTLLSLTNLLSLQVTTTETRSQVSVSATQSDFLTVTKITGPLIGIAYYGAYAGNYGYYYATITNATQSRIVTYSERTNRIRVDNLTGKVVFEETFNKLPRCVIGINTIGRSTEAIQLELVRATKTRIIPQFRTSGNYSGKCKIIEYKTNSGFSRSTGGTRAEYDPVTNALTNADKVTGGAAATQEEETIYLNEVRATRLPPLHPGLNYCIRPTSYAQTILTNAGQTTGGIITKSLPLPNSVSSTVAKAYAYEENLKRIRGQFKCQLTVQSLLLAPKWKKCIARIGAYYLDPESIVIRFDKDICYAEIQGGFLATTSGRHTLPRVYKAFPVDNSLPLAYGDLREKEFLRYHPIEEFVLPFRNKPSQWDGKVTDGFSIVSITGLPTGLTNYRDVIYGVPTAPTGAYPIVITASYLGVNYVFNDSWVVTNASTQPIDINAESTEINETAVSTNAVYSTVTILGLDTTDNRSNGEVAYT